MTIFTEIMSSIGLVVCIISAWLLLLGWATKVDEVARHRSTAVFNEDAKDKVIYTRKLFLWAFMPAIFPFVLIYLLIKVIIGWVASLVNAAKDLQLGKSVDKL